MLLSLLSKRSLNDDSRDAYGFTVRPQHIHRYREYANIYKEEEEERLQKWKTFLEQQVGSTSTREFNEDNSGRVVSEVTKQLNDPAETVSGESDDSNEPARNETVSGESEKKSDNDTEEEGIIPNKEAPITTQHAKSLEVQTWAKISPSLDSIEQMLSTRVKKRKNMEGKTVKHVQNDLPSIDEAKSESEDDDDEDEDDDDDDDDDDKDVVDSVNASEVEISASDKMYPEPFFPRREELEFLVRGGVPKELRGEVWQAFVGVRTRRVETYYQDLLSKEDDDGSGGQEHDKYDLPEKWRKQIEKVVRCMGPGLF